MKKREKNEMIETLGNKNTENIQKMDAKNLERFKQEVGKSKLKRSKNSEESEQDKNDPVKKKNNKTSKWKDDIKRIQKKK